MKQVMSTASEHKSGHQETAGRFRIGPNDEAAVFESKGLVAFSLTVDESYQDGTFLLKLTQRREERAVSFNAEGKVFAGLVALIGTRVPPRLLVIAREIKTTVEELRASTFEIVEIVPSEKVSEELRKSKFFM